ncbi:MAG: S8 family serine peptidase [Pirellulales bacterium]
MPNPLGDEKRKVQPKLRMIADCSAEVNAVRAELSASITVEPSVADRLPVLRGMEPVTLTQSLVAPPPPPKLLKMAEGVRVNVFVETQDRSGGLPDALEGQARRGNVVAATIALDELPRIAKDPRVLSVELGDPIATPTPQISGGGKEPDTTRWKFGSSQQHREGRGVLIGIIDVQGFDFSHPDFLDGKKTRFVRIWDQGGNARPSPHQQDSKRFGPQFDFGAEFRQEHLNKAIVASAKLRLPPHEIEKQSQMSPGSHGTHVASIAAGNHGVCRKATIAAVLISLPQGDANRRKTFTDSTRIAHAVDYLLALADELDMPISINISLGTNGHAHDGTAAISRWIDSCLSVPGRSVCVAAGNAGQEVAAFPGDLGFVMGRIHTSGEVAGRHLHKDLEWEVIGDRFVDVSENELEIWYSAQDRFAVSVRPPWQGADLIGPVEPGQYIENHQLRNQSFLSIYNELYHPSNGSNYISIYLTPFFGRHGVIGVASGTWVVRLHGLDVRDGRYDGWIERDDPRRLGRLAVQEAWAFPSYFSESSHVDDSSVGSLACGRRVVSVANLHELDERINITSSQGPTRDNRNKPDVAAPGTDIVAANGFAGADDLWIAMSGTSMASPFVAGVAGLMLACQPQLTAAQIEGIIHRTSRPLPGHSFEWANDAGFGMIQPGACLREAELVNERKEAPP